MNTTDFIWIYSCKFALELAFLPLLWAVRIDRQKLLSQRAKVIEMAQSFGLIFGPGVMTSNVHDLLHAIEATIIVRPA